MTDNVGILVSGGEVTPVDLAVVRQAPLVNVKVVDDRSSHRSDVTRCRCGSQTDGDRRTHRCGLVGVSEPFAQCGHPRVGDGELLGLPSTGSAWRCRGCDEAILLQSIKLAVDLLVGGHPEVAERSVESTRQFDAGRFTLEQRSQDRERQ
jgi:hypothetical protein